MIEPVLDDLGFRLVRVRLGGTGRRILQIMAERADGAPMTVDHCADISRAVSARLDQDDPIAGDYDLEVSSPGIDRPLVAAADFERFAGHEVQVDMINPVSGRRRFRGTLKGVDDGHVLVVCRPRAKGGKSGRRARSRSGGRPESESESAPIALPLREVRDAKLVLTDALIAGQGETPA